MLSKFNFKKYIFGINSGNFNAMALNLFHYQSVHNTIYKKYLQLLHIIPEEIQEVRAIPFMPISFFKTNKIETGAEQDKIVFQSSGTSKQVRSKHYVKDPDFYAALSKQIFEIQFGNLTDYIILALLPSYLENKDSSLVFMVNHFIKMTGHPDSSFINRNSGKFVHQVYQQRGNKKVLLLGVTYALIEFAEEHQLPLQDAMIMETGGMKGKGEERPREEVHEVLKKHFQVREVYSEYGMTELLSQAYSVSGGNFQVPFSMNLYTREMNDPLTLNDQKSPGGLNIIDLANIDSCAFIATEDIGKINNDGTFIVSGRIDNSEIRGCNLLSIG